MREYLEIAQISPLTSRVALFALILLYILLTAFASFRHLWHDELYTYYIANAPSLSRLWQEIHLDLNPPLEYLAARASMALLGPTSYAVRLPSIIGFLVGSLCLYRAVARRLSSPYGLLAMLVFWGSPFFYYATEARPYALVIGFLGITLLVWQRAIEPGRHISLVFLLALAVTGMMLSHLMAVLYIAPFCVAELARSYHSRKVDRGIWAALLAPCLIPPIYLHMMSRFETSVFPPVFQASFRKMAESYYGSLKLEALPLLLALGLALLVATRREASGENKTARVTSVEAVLVAGFLMMPVIVNLVLMHSHAAYFDRYAFPVSFGYALLVSFFLASRTNLSRLAPIAASCVLILFVCAFNLGPGLKGSVWDRGETAFESGRSRSIDQVRPDLPLVAASGLTFLELDKYGDAQTVARLCYLTDRTLAIRYARATIFEGMPALKQYFPIRARVIPYSRFISEYPTFLVLGTPGYPEDWLLRALVGTGADVRYLGEFPGPYKDEQLYQVTIPKG